MSHTCDTHTHLWHPLNQETECIHQPLIPKFPTSLMQPIPQSHTPPIPVSRQPIDLISVMIDLFALLEFYINGNIKVCTLFSESGFSLLVYLFWDLSVYYVFQYSISFFWWVGLPLHGYTTNLWTLIYQWRLLYHPLCGHTLSVLLDEHLGVEWLGCRIGASLTFQETAKLFSKSGCHSTAITLHICLFILKILIN